MKILNTAQENLLKQERNFGYRMALDRLQDETDAG